MTELRKKLYSPQQQELHNTLSDYITVYRSTFSPAGVAGLSWTTDMDVAENFYRIACSQHEGSMAFMRMSTSVMASEFERMDDLFKQTPVKCETIIRKEDCFVIGQRGESELFCPWVLDKDVKQLSAFGLLSETN